MPYDWSEDELDALCARLTPRLLAAQSPPPPPTEAELETAETLARIEADTAVELARINAGAATDVAESAAEAATDIAEAEAEAVEAVAEVDAAGAAAAAEAVAEPVDDTRASIVREALAERLSDNSDDDVVLVDEGDDDAPIPVLSDEPPTSGHWIHRRVLG